MTTRDYLSMLTHINGLYADSRRTPEEDLFASVLIQAIADCGITARNSDARRHRDEARRWLTEQPSSFQYVCDLADIHPDTVIAALESFQKRGAKWHGWTKTGRFKRKETHRWS